MSSQAATTREITNMQAEAKGQNTSRVLDMAKENSLRSQGTNRELGMMKYEAIPGGSQLLIAFDADYHENPHVARAFARLLKSLSHASSALNSRARIEILTWKEEFKGIDDALLARASIVSKSPLEWFKSISMSCQGEIADILQV